MKIFAILALALVSFQTNGHAAEALECDAGKPGYDNYVFISVTDEFVSFGRHEFQVAVTNANLIKDGNTIAVINKTLKAAAEGDTFDTNVSALVVMNPENKTALVTLVVDGRPLIEAKLMKCK